MEISQELFEKLWSGEISEVADNMVQLATGGKMQAALDSHTRENVNGVVVSLFESRVVTPLQTTIEFREQNPDKYFEYVGPNGELTNTPNINVRDVYGNLLGHKNAKGVFVKDVPLPKQPSPIVPVLLATANGKYQVWPASILHTNPAQWVLEVNAYLFS
jgi:hypothetical protein